MYSRLAVGHAAVVVFSTSGSASLGPRIAIVAVIVIGAAPTFYVMVRALIGLRRMPRRKLNSQQRRLVAGALIAWALLLLVGALVGYVVAQGDQIAGAVGGGFVGSVLWVIGCWTAGAAIKHRRSRTQA